MPSRSAPISGVQGRACGEHGIADAVRAIGRRALRVDEGEQRGLVQREGANTTRIDQSRNQCNGGTVGVPDQGEWCAGKRQDWLDEVDFIAQGNLALRVPVRALPGAIAVGGEHMMVLGELIHEAAPLCRAAGVGMNADHAWARPRFAEMRL